MWLNLPLPALIIRISHSLGRVFSVDSPMSEVTISRLPPTAYASIVPAAAFLMQQIINNENLAFTYLAPASIEAVTEWWHSITPEVLAERHIVFYAHEAHDTSKLLGIVILALHQKPNAHHRADVQRLMVSKEARGR